VQTIENIKDITQCYNCGSNIKNECNSYHVWEIEYECGCKIWGALDTKTHGDKINLINKCINE
jgi:hypothetical protein